MIILYQFPTSPFCEKVRRILHYKGLDFATIDVPRADVARYAHVSPSGKFPAIDHDGQAIQDSTEIARYLDTAFPAAPLIPSNPKVAALVHIMEDWADESLYFYELAMRLAWPHNAARAVPAFAATMPGLSVTDVLEKLTAGATALTTNQGLGRKAHSAIVRDAERHMRSLDAMLADGDWLVGDTITLADVAVLSQVRALMGADEVVQITALLPRIAAWDARVTRLAPP